MISMTVREIINKSSEAELVVANATQIPNERSELKEWPTIFPESVYTLWGKRVFDLGFALILLPLLLLPILAMALLVKLDGGPAFFGHKRVGKDGKEFWCLKLRTMRTDAEAYLEKHLAENEDARAEWDANFKLRNDPRITRLGKFLRKTSLDELPQIFNVLSGDMSFVGPRPVPALELSEYGSAQHAYLSGRPGITGPWQVSGRNDLDYQTRIDLDVSYRHSESFLGDTIVILKTPLKVFKPTGI